MFEYSIYRPDGTIFVTGTTYDEGSKLETLQAWLPFDHLDGLYDPDIYYVSDGQPLPREPLPHRREGEIIYDLPAGTIATILGEAYLVEDGELELVPDGMGPVLVTLSCPPRYLNLIVEVPGENLPEST